MKVILQVSIPKIGYKFKIKHNLLIIQIIVKYN